MGDNSESEDRHNLGRNYLSMAIENQENQAKQCHMTRKNRAIATGLACCIIGLIAFVGINQAMISANNETIAQHDSKLAAMTTRHELEMKELRTNFGLQLKAINKTLQNHQEHVDDSSLETEVVELRKTVRKNNLSKIHTF